jgi:hypothetical protein
VYKLFVAQALLPMLGGTVPGLVLLGLAALRCPGWAVAGWGLLMALGYGAVACGTLPAVLVGESFWLIRPLEQAIFGSCGLLLMVTVFAAGCVLLFGRFGEEDSEPETDEGPAPSRSPIALVRRNLDWFLLLWLLLELGAYIALSPFGAARRVMSLAVVATLLLGRQAARAGVVPARRAVLTGLVLGSSAVGLLFYGVDLLDARVQRNAPEAAAGYIHAQQADPNGPSPTIWYVGHWGFQFYAERAGMKPVVPDFSLLRRGDWLIVPDRRWEQQTIAIDPDRARAEPVVVRIPETLPWRTVRCFYGGYVPLEHHAGPRMEVAIYRITGDWVPRTARAEH